MIGSIQMICGMGFIIGTLRLVFGPKRAEAFWLAFCCGLVWYGLSLIYGGATPE